MQGRGPVQEPGRNRISQASPEPGRALGRCRRTSPSCRLLSGKQDPDWFAVQVKTPPGPAALPAAAAARTPNPPAAAQPRGEAAEATFASRGLQPSCRTARPESRPGPQRPAEKPQHLEAALTATVPAPKPAKGPRSPTAPGSCWPGCLPRHARLQGPLDGAAELLAGTRLLLHASDPGEPRNKQRGRECRSHGQHGSGELGCTATRPAGDASARSGPADEPRSPQPVTAPWAARPGPALTRAR